MLRPCQSMRRNSLTTTWHGFSQNTLTDRVTLFDSLGDDVPATLMPYLELDDTREEAIEALINQARSDANMTNSECNNPNSCEGKLICALFEDAPVANPENSPVSSHPASAGNNALTPS